MPGHYKDEADAGGAMRLPGERIGRGAGDEERGGVYRGLEEKLSDDSGSLCWVRYSNAF